MALKGGRGGRGRSKEVKIEVRHCRVLCLFSFGVVSACASRGNIAAAYYEAGQRTSRHISFRNRAIVDARFFFFAYIFFVFVCFIYILGSLSAL